MLKVIQAAAAVRGRRLCGSQQGNGSRHRGEHFRDYRASNADVLPGPPASQRCFFLTSDPISP
jgi:hypothetical protein